MAGNTAILSVRILGDADGATKAYKQAEAGADKFAGKMDKLKDQTEVAGIAAGAALTKGLYDAVNADTANRKLAGQLNLGAADAEAAGKMAGDLYTDAYGDSLEQVNSAIGAVGSTLAKMSDNGGADVERLSKKALDMAATFDTDVAESVSSAGILMKTGLAKDGDQAFDLLIGSMQKMPAAMRSELLPVMDEYSKHFADLGIDGETAFGIMVEASKNGAIGMDKAGDALKEFQIRATDMSKTTAGAYEALGLGQEDMTAKLLAGGDTAEEAFGKIVHGLQNIEDPVARSQAALALFGTPLEDLSVAQIPEFLGAIDPMGDKFDTVAGAADNLGKKIGEGPGVAVEKFTREALGQLQGFAAQAIPFLQPLLDKATEYSHILGPMALVIAGVAAAQWLWNAAAAAHPLGLIIIAIAAIAAGVIWAYENVGWFRDGIDRLGAMAGPLFEGIGKAIDNVIQWLDKVLAPVGGIEGALGIMGGVAKKIFDDIISNISNMIGWIQSAIDWFNSLFGAKDRANSGPVGNADGGSLAPLMGAQSLVGVSSFAAGSESLTGTSSLVGASSLASTSSSIGSMAGSRMQLQAGPTINIEVKADATTDSVRLGRELIKSINEALTAQGKPKLVTA